jgi:hypothetical protein
MNTIDAVLFLVSLSYIFIIFATGPSASGDASDGFDKTSGSKYFSYPDQHIPFFRRYLRSAVRALKRDFCAWAAVCKAGRMTGVAQ